MLWLAVTYALFDVLRPFEESEILHWFQELVLLLTSANHPLPPICISIYNYLTSVSFNINDVRNSPEQAFHSECIVQWRWQIDCMSHTIDKIVTLCGWLKIFVLMWYGDVTVYARYYITHIHKQNQRYVKATTTTTKSAAWVH